MPSPELAPIVAALRADPLAAAPTLLAMRESYEAMAAAPLAGTRCEPIVHAGVACEWVLAPGVSGDRAIYFLHGGGYTMGSVNTHRALAARLSQAARARVLLVDYRRAPEAPFPAAVDDAALVYQARLQELAAEGRLAVVGDSAGAGLGLACLLIARDAGAPLPVACAWLSPWVDLALTGASIATRAHRDPSVTEATLREMAAAYLGGRDPREPLASPLYADLSRLPPTLVQVGTEEILHDDAPRLADAARAAGVEVTFEEWPDMFHVWHAFAGALPEADEAIASVGAFLDRAF
jgi:acetyl esterase/lipase